MMETNKQLALWNYFWSEVDAGKAESREEICSLKMLASIGYDNALVTLRKYLGESIENVEEKEVSESSTDIDLRSMGTDSLPDIAAFAADSLPGVIDCEVDSEGVVEVEYLKMPIIDETQLLESSDEEADDSSYMDDTVCFAYNYGGPELEDTQGWDRLGLLPDPWAEARHPTAVMITPEDLTIDELVPDLTVLTISSGMGNLALAPDLQGYSYTKLQLPAKGIKAVELLKHYPYLQYVDLANNCIEDPSPLWKITNLVVLDLSNNNLTDSSIEKPDQIKFLTYLNLSHNKFTSIPDFSNCWAIKHFNLAFNQIKCISLLSEFKYLSYLNLSYNKLEFIKNLENKVLSEINFSHNSISSWTDPGPKEIHDLENIDISYNQLPTLKIFAEMYNLATLDVSYNKISEMSEFDALLTLPVVTNLKIAGNQITTIIPDPRRLIIYLLPSIKILDGVPISSMERVSAVSMFASNPLQQMVCKGMKSYYRKYSKFPTVGWERPKLTGDHPALIILIGDIGSARTAVMKKVQRMNPHICKEVKLTTTRPKLTDEVGGSKLRCISLEKFNQLEKEDLFFLVERRLGHKFGIENSQLEDKNRVLMSYMGMSTALEAVWKGFKPTLIVMLPNQEEVLTQRCVKLFLSSDVYRSKFKVKRGSRRRTNDPDNEDYDDEEMGRYSIKKSSVLLLKKPKLIKCRSMFFPSNSKKKKWKIKRYTENLGLNNKLLEECYGKYFASAESKVFLTEPCIRSSRVSFGYLMSPTESCFDIAAAERSSQSSKLSTGENELKRFVQDVFRNQMKYREMHVKNPGLFQLFISSDNTEKAAYKLLEVVKSLYIKLEDQKKIKTINFQNDPNYKSMVEDPIMKLVNEVTTHDLPLDIAI